MTTFTSDLPEKSSPKSKCDNTGTGGKLNSSYEAQYETLSLAWGVGA
jgi:hypothetical protein